MLSYMLMMTSNACALTIENGVRGMGGGAAVRAAERSAAPRSGRGGNRFSKKIGGYPRALIAAPPAVTLGLSRRASSLPVTPNIASLPLRQRAEKRLYWGTRVLVTSRPSLPYHPDA